jgi:hypothetical protein
MKSNLFFKNWKNYNYQTDDCKISFKSPLTLNITTKVILTYLAALYLYQLTISNLLYCTTGDKK